MLQDGAAWRAAHAVMLQCWSRLPRKRPGFSVLDREVDRLQQRSLAAPGRRQGRAKREAWSAAAASFTDCALPYEGSASSESYEYEAIR